MLVRLRSFDSTLDLKQLSLSIQPSRKNGRKSEPSELGTKRFKLLDLFTVQQQQVHKLRIQF